jgi:hypothetical protein
MVFEQLAAKPLDLLGRRPVLGVGLGLYRQQQVGCHVGSQRVDVRLQFGSQAADFALQFGSGFAHLGAEASEQVKNESFGFAGYSHIISERVGERKKATLLIST